MSFAKYLLGNKDLQSKNRLETLEMQLRDIWQTAAWGSATEGGGYSSGLSFATTWNQLCGNSMRKGSAFHCADERTQLCLHFMGPKKRWWQGLLGLRWVEPA